MFLQNENLTIRNAEIKDAEQIKNWWNDGNVMSHAGFPKGLNISIESVESTINNCNINNQLLIIQVGDDLVGEMNYRVKERTAEIGIKICDFTYHNKGYGTKFLKMLIDFLFDELECQEIELDTNLNNIPAQKLYEKLGFIRKEVSIDSWKNQLGELQSSVFYHLKDDKSNL